jgi:uncharacterized membrane-anchored protein
MIPRLLAGAALAVTLVGVNLRVADYEAALASGDRVYLPIRGYDPRSLIQGDYMRLTPDVLPDAPERLHGVATLDAYGVVRAVRAGDAAPGPSERRIRWRMDEDRVAYGANEWFIEEGTADAYQGFTYAALHLSEDGRTLLVGLAGPDRTLLGPRPARWFGAPPSPAPERAWEAGIEAEIEALEAMEAEIEGEAPAGE